MVALNYANKINGFTHLNITKLDALSEMEELKIAPPDKLGTVRPPQLFRRISPLLAEQVEVIYETLPGWKSDISKVRSWDDMPENAKKHAYAMLSGELSRIECRYIGVGPGRDAMVVKP